MKNPAHLDNFVSANTSLFKGYRIIGLYTNAKGEPSQITYSNGKTIEKAKERFYMRYVLRVCDREMMLQDQKRGSLVIQFIEANHATLIERNPQLIVEMS